MHRAALALGVLVLVMCFFLWRLRQGGDRVLAGLPADAKLISLKADTSQMNSGAVVSATVAELRRYDPLMTFIGNEQTISTENRFWFTLDDGKPHKELMTIRVQMTVTFEEGDVVDISIPPGEGFNKSWRAHPIHLRLSNILLQEAIENGMSLSTVNFDEFLPGRRVKRGDYTYSEVLRKTWHALEMRGFKVKRMEFDISFPSLKRLTGHPKLEFEISKEREI